MDLWRNLPTGVSLGLFMDNDSGLEIPGDGGLVPSMKTAMTDLTEESGHSTPLQSGVVIETLRQVISGAEIVATVVKSDSGFLGLDAEAWVTSASKSGYSYISDRVLAQLEQKAPVSSFSCTVEGVVWGVLVEGIETNNGAVTGALLVARHGRAWSRRERALVKTFGGLLSHAATLAVREAKLLHQRRLDLFVSQIAERLMSGSSQTRQEVLDETVADLADFVGADVAFVRRNDHLRGLSILEAEWPKREVTGPDPLGEVPFDADPIFAATKDLRQPFLPDSENQQADYQERVEKASGVPRVWGAGVPLILADETWGVLGFIHFQRYDWTPEEVSALQAVASMLVQLQARIDAERRTEHIALHDDLTGLPNRRSLLRELDERLASHQRTAILFFDLDRFKVMNDFLGHASGDRVLTTIADRLRLSIRHEDFAARLGGDEFVVLLADADHEMGVLATAYRILDIVGRPVDFPGHQISHTSSVGIVLSEPGTRNAMELLGRADVALYAAKKQGRHQAVVFDEELEQSVNERSRTELTLREAIEGNGLRLHYQPEIDLRTGEVLAVEALVRWEHPTRGLLSALEFIPVAEETGLVVDLGRWVFQRACEQLAEWCIDYPDLPLIMRVNCSPAQFVVGGLVEFVKECMRINQIPGNRLCIEITEHAVLQEPEQTARILREFQSLGVEVAIDDFGTGYASMTELKRLPANILKLDMSFVQGITTDPSDQAIVEAIIRLGRALDLEIVAEGIETGATVEKLLELNCHRGQGYLMSRPLSAEDLAPILSAGSVPSSLLHPVGVGSFAIPDSTL